MMKRSVIVEEKVTWLVEWGIEWDSEIVVDNRHMKIRGGKVVTSSPFANVAHPFIFTSISNPYSFMLTFLSPLSHTIFQDSYQLRQAFLRPFLYLTLASMMTKP